MHVDGPMLVLAGAGSGKTRVITRRIAYLIRRGIPPYNVLAITFTNKAADEMRRRVGQMDVPPGTTICTFHSLCAMLLRQFAEEAELSADYTIYDRDDQIKLIKKAITLSELSTDNLTPARVLGSIGGAKNDLKTPEAYAAEAEGFYRRNVSEIYRRYESLLAANNALDFDDLLLRMAFLLREKPEIRELLGRRYRYILIDEYQDINHAQYIIAHGVAMDHRNICATGDPDQSIYAWRGADINNILEFETDYPDALVVRLEENYRSTKPILSAAARLIGHNVMRKDKALWTRRVGGPNVRVVYCNDERAEADHIAERIGARRSAGGEYADVAVFYRVNSLSRVLEEAFLKAGVPYRIARGVEFYSRKEVKDVLAYLKLLVNPADDLSCLRIINTPPRGIGAVTVKRLGEFASGRAVSILSACRRAEEAPLRAAAAKRLKAFAALMESFSADPDRPVEAIVEDVVRRSGLAAALRDGDEDDREAYANIGELISAAARFEAAGGGGTLRDYLQQVSLVSDVDRFEGGGGAVTFMTLHAAKGLEFPVVFVVGCEDGLLPLRREDARQAGGYPGGQRVELEEERRLVFVGMTRAQDELTLTCARRRMIRGRITPQAASAFLGEIGTESVTVEEKTGPLMSTYLVGRPPGGKFCADVRERAIIEADQKGVSLPEGYEYLKVGCRVHHRLFGRGKVVRMWRRWPDTRARIDFNRYGPKTIVLQHAALELV